MTVCMDCDWGISALHLASSSIPVMPGMDTSVMSTSTRLRDNISNASSPDSAV
ncbi:hypothetical protein D3C72_2418470 [compost metagenome]